MNIRQRIRQEIESIMSNPRRVLRLAVGSILESESKHPGKLRSLYYNVRPSLSVEQLLLSNSSVTGNDLDHHRNINDDSLEKLMIDEAEQLYNRIEKALTKKGITNSTESSSQLRLSGMLPSLSTDENR